MTNPVGYEGHELDAAAAVLEDLVSPTPADIYLATRNLSPRALAAAVGAVAVAGGSQSSLYEGAGVISDTMPRSLMRDSITLSSGGVYGAEIGLAGGQMVTAVSVQVNTAATNPSLFRIAIYDADFVLVASSDNETAAAEATGVQTVALSTPYTPPSSGLYYPAVICVADAGPHLGGLTAWPGAAAEPRENGSRHSWAQGGQTDLPATATPGTNGERPWFELS